MRRIFTIGETVLDIIFKDGIPVAAKPGGSMLNASVTLGRLNIPVCFLSEYGTDQVGNMIDHFLSTNGIDMRYSYRFKDGKSALALAFLDKYQNAEYSFYKAYPQKRLNIEIPDITGEDIVLFGSFYGISPEVRETVLKILLTAKENKALIIYDPNFRKSHLHQLNELLPFIQENIQLADIIKGSHEDFETIFKAVTPGTAFSTLNDPTKVLIYTAGNKGAFMHSEKEQVHIPAKAIEPVSTVGAGDNFNAGLTFGLISNEVDVHNLLSISSSIWKDILFHGISFASEVCMSYDNYISKKYASAYLKRNN